MIKITVITVSLNAASTIEQTICSVLDQGYQHLEYIIVDGGSTDGTLGIIDKYRDRLALVISEPDDGIYSAFNKGLRNATGDLIGILNADDFYAPWALATIAETYNMHRKYEILYGKVVVLDSSRSRWTVYPLGDHQRLVNQMSISHPAVFVSKRTYDEMGLFDEYFKISGDWEWLLRCHFGNRLFFPVDRVLTAFRNDGASSGITKKIANENESIYMRYLNRYDAFLKILKMRLKNQVRKMLGVFDIYNKYADYRDKNIAIAENSGEFSEEAVFLWSSIEKH